MGERKVKTLSECVSRKISTGQVVLGLAAACKELIENSLDAGAKNIEVRVRNYGSEFLEVLDNGDGIKEEDHALLCFPHSTSKLERFSDLEALNSYGFRGEALTALCSLSNVSVATRHKNDSIGYSLKYDNNGVLLKTTKTARQVGTTVRVENLFGNLPVRRKDLMGNLRREFNKLLAVVQSYAIISTDARISCCNLVLNKKHVFIATNGNATLRENVCNIFNSKEVSSLKEIVQVKPGEKLLTSYGISGVTNDEFSLIKITGLVSSCHRGKGRNSMDKQFVFVNGRPCDFFKVIKVSNEVYREFNRSQYPFLVLNINVPKNSLDVNLTPDKRSLLVDSERLLMATVQASLESLFFGLGGKCASVGKTLPFASSELCTDFSGEQALNTYTDLSEERAELKQKKPDICAYDTENQNQNRKESEITTLRLSSPLRKRENKIGFNGKRKQSEFGGESPVQKLKLIFHEPTEKVIPTPAATCCSENSSTSKKSEPYCFQEESLNRKTDLEIPNGNSDLSGQKEAPNLQKEKKEPNSYLRSYSCRKPTETMFSVDGFDKRYSMVKKQEVPGDQLLIRRHFFAKLTPSETEKAESELTKCLSKSEFQKMEVLGQFNLGFIISRLNDDLFIVDQHASDEKHSFEKLQRNATVQTQRLLEPKDIGINSISENIIMDNLGIFNKNGFTFQIDESCCAGHRIKLTGVPVLQGLNFDIQDIEELVALLNDFPGRLYRPSRMRKIFASRACRTSIMIGTALTPAKMKQILQQLATLDHPWNCPHGRPTIRHLFNLNAIPADQ